MNGTDYLSNHPSFFNWGGRGGRSEPVSYSTIRASKCPAKQGIKRGNPALNLSLTSHTVHMEKPKLPWLRVAVLMVEVLLLVAAVAFPLVISDAVLANFLKILELVARVS